MVVLVVLVKRQELRDAILVVVVVRLLQNTHPLADSLARTSTDLLDGLRGDDSIHGEREREREREKTELL